MRRREFIAALGGAVAWPVVAQAQQSRKIPRVGVLWHAGNEQEEAIYLGALRQGLNDLGYIEGKNIELLNRFADEHYDRFDALATELVETKVDVIVAIIPPSVSAAKKATSTIPIVFIGNADPVGLHHVDSLAHPGGNLTGLSAMFTDLTAKQLGILKDSLPGLTSVALLTNPTNPLARAYEDNAQTASRSANIKLSIVDIGRPDDLTHVFSTIAEQKLGAAILSADGMLYNERKRVADLAIAHRLPTVGAVREMAEAGLLLSYGPEFPDLFRRAGVYIDKILKGAKVADLPVELPTKFNLIVNLATAHAIGVTIPDSTQLLADKLIE
jgi:putative ABC transport system substrate-binding protein